MDGLTQRFEYTLQHLVDMIYMYTNLQYYILNKRQTGVIVFYFPVKIIRVNSRLVEETRLLQRQNAENKYRYNHNRITLNL